MQLTDMGDKKGPQLWEALQKKPDLIGFSELVLGSDTIYWIKTDTGEWVKKKSSKGQGQGAGEAPVFLRLQFITC